MFEKYVTYFEAHIGSMLLQVNCSSREHYIDVLTYLEEKFPRMEIIFREWSDDTEEDGVIPKEDWFNG